MVKLPVAEKSRVDNVGTSGASFNNKPIVMMEKPSFHISREQKEGLMKLIIRKRQRKQEEIDEADAVEQQRKENENRKKEHAMTLEDLNNSIEKDRLQIEILTKKKRDLFIQLKKVLHTEDTKRKEKAEENHSNYMKQEGDAMSGHQQYQQQIIVSGHAQQMRFPPNMIASGQPNPAAMQSLYKVGPPNGGPLRRKRSRSPSPPPMASNLYKPTHIHIQKPAVTSYMTPQLSHGGVYYHSSGTTPVSSSHHYGVGLDKPHTIYMSRQGAIAMDQKKQEQVDIYNAQGGPPMMPIQPQPLKHKPGSITAGFPVVRTQGNNPHNFPPNHTPAYGHPRNFYQH